MHWVPYVENAYRNNQHNRDNDLKELEMIKSDWEESKTVFTQGATHRLKPMSQNWWKEQS